jgi:hypothetical protein
LGLTGSPLAEYAGTATVTATLSATYSLPVTVNLAFSGTATPTTDYTASANSIAIPAGSTSGSIALTAVQDTVSDPNETIIVDIDTVANGTETGTQQVTATITDDDPAPAVTSFTAYNDFVTSYTANANVTHWGWPQVGTSQILKDETSGATVTPTMTLTHLNTVDNGDGPGAEIGASTPAGQIFNGKVAGQGKVIYYGNAGNWWFNVEFAGLDNNKTYEVATFTDRGNSNYDNKRWTLISLVGSDSSNYACSAGTGNYKISETAVSQDSGYNTIEGDVAKWTGIKPGADGKFSVNFTFATDAQIPAAYRATNSDGYGYAPAGLMLRETTPANQPPTFAGYAVSGTTNQPLSIYPAKILAEASDPDGDAISLTKVFGPSAQGGTVALTTTSVDYTPPANYVGTDTFEVEITDAHGVKAWGLVTVTLAAAPSGVGQNQTDFTILPDGKVDMVFRGIPGRNYTIQRSPDLTNWSDLATVPAGADGKIPYIDPNPLVPNGFYRTKSN